MPQTEIPKDTPDIFYNTLMSVIKHAPFVIIIIPEGEKDGNDWRWDGEHYSSRILSPRALKEKDQLNVDQVTASLAIDVMELFISTLKEHGL